MVGPIRVDGLFSGIDFTSLIGKLVSVERRPIESIEKRIAADTTRKTAYLDLSARLLSLRTSANTLSLPSFFNRVSVASSNETAVRASGALVASTGAFTFQVRRLAQSHQVLSNGFADTNTTRIGPGTLTIEFGDGGLSRATSLAQLNGGRGVDRGFLRVTDNSGASAIIDLQGAVTLRDVTDALNADTRVRVFASVDSDRLVIQDRTGASGTGLKVENVGLDTTASDLGLAGKTAVNLGGSPPDVRLFGASVNDLSAATPLSQLNDGLGIRTSLGDDFTIQPKAGASFGVDIPATALTVQGVLDAINGDADNGGRVVASINGEGTGIELRDASGGVGLFSVGPAGNATLRDLGLLDVSARNEATGQADPAGTLLSGRRLVASLDGLLTRTLNGGVPAASATDLFAGVRDGTVRLQNRAGAPAVDVNLSGRSVFDFDSIVAGPQPTIRVATPAGTPASFAVGNRITLSGTDGGVGRTLARTITGVSVPAAGFTDLRFDEALPATFTIAAGNAVTAVVEGSADVLRLLTAAGAPIGVSARVNDEGNGLLLIDASSGGGKMSVENLRTSLSVGAAPGATSVTVGSAAGFRVGQTIRLSGGGATETRVITSIAGADLALDSPLAAAGGYAAGAEVSGVAAADLGLVNAGRAESGTAATFTDNDLIGHPDDFFVGATVTILAGPNAGVERTVADFDGATGTVTLGGAPLGAALDGSTVYRVSFDPGRVAGRDLDPQSIGEGTLLASLNGGSGVAKGRFQITDRRNRQIVVDLRQPDDLTVGKALADINNAAAAAGSTLAARLNDAGDGILLVDSDPGGVAIRVDELDGGRTARDLNLFGVAAGSTPQSIDGSFEFRIPIATPSTLEEIVSAVNGRGIPVTASILNDGSGATPYRLAILSNRPGRVGRMTVGASEGFNGVLRFSTTARAEDAVLLFGTDSGANDPGLIISSSNTVTQVIPGLTLDLLAPSAGPVTVTVSRDLDGVVDQVGRLTDSFNDVRGKIDELTDLNTDTQKRGILFGDAAVQAIERQLADVFTRAVPEIPSGRLNTLGRVGITFDTTGHLVFDETRLRSELSSRFDEVRDLFTLQAKLTLGTPLTDLNSGLGVSRVEGSDFRIFQRDGTAITVDLLSGTRAGDVLSAINVNADNTGDLTAAFSPDGFGFTLSDASGPASFAADAGTGGATLVAAPGSPFDGKPDDFYNGMMIRRPDTGEIAMVVDFAGATRQFTLSQPIFTAAGEPFAVDLQAVNVSGARTASDLGLAKVASAGAAVLSGSFRNLAGDPGAAPRIARRLSFLTDEPAGLIPTRADSLDEKISRSKDTIERLEKRIERLEERLVKQFSRLEQFIADSQGTMNQLQSSFVNLIGSRAPRRQR